jgi:hypothetical protein
MIGELKLRDHIARNTLLIKCPSLSKHSQPEREYILSFTWREWNSGPSCYIACYGILQEHPNIILPINPTYSITRAILSYQLRSLVYQSHVHLRMDHRRRRPAQAAFL